MLQTTFANGINPFTGKPAEPMKTSPKTKPIDINAVHKNRPDASPSSKAEKPAPAVASVFPALPKSITKNCVVNSPTATAATQPQKPPGIRAVTKAPLSVRVQAGLYDEWFRTLSPGQCIEVDPDAHECVKGYLARYIKRSGRPMTFKGSKNQPDGIGRIWILAKD